MTSRDTTRIIVGQECRGVTRDLCVSRVGGADSFRARVGPIAHHFQSDEIATDCRTDPMSDRWPLLVAEPLDCERLVNSQLRPRAGAIAIGRHDYSAARQAVVELCGTWGGGGMPLRYRSLLARPWTNDVQNPEREQHRRD
jgi:hypothetical protein